MTLHYLTIYKICIAVMVLSLSALIFVGPRSAKWADVLQDVFLTAMVLFLAAIAAEAI